jgi:hypothetical protein
MTLPSRIIYLIPCYLQAVHVHLANGVNLKRAWRGVLSSTPPNPTGSRSSMSVGNKAYKLYHKNQRIKDNVVEVWWWPPSLSSAKVNNVWSLITIFPIRLNVIVLEQTEHVLQYTTVSVQPFHPSQVRKFPLALQFPRLSTRRPNAERAVCPSPKLLNEIRRTLVWEWVLYKIIGCISFSVQYIISTIKGNIKLYQFSQDLFIVLKTVKSIKNNTDLHLQFKYVTACI